LTGRRLERAAAVAALAFVVLSCRKDRATAPQSAHPAGAAPNVLLITLDTLRPDALGWVAGVNATPALDRLASAGFRFPSAVSPVPLTFPAHASVLTGVLPRRLGIRDNGQTLGPAPPTLAEISKARGYATAAFVSGYPLARAFGLDRGFDVYDDRFSHVPGSDPRRGSDPGTANETLERRASETTAAAVSWLSTARRPWFLWVHYFDPHYPYEPPRELVRPGRRGAYDGEVAFADRSIGDLLGRAEASAGAKLLTVFAGDHGESLGEHGEGTHGFFVYDSTVLVPLVFRFPGALRPGESRSPARLVDVAPTVLELLGHPGLEGADGTSLLPTFRGALQAIPPAYVETYQPWLSYGWSPLKALRQDEWKLIAAPRPELYWLAEDPREERNLFGAERERARRLEVARRGIESLPSVGTAQTAPDAEAVAKLRSLGYLGAGGGAGEPPASGLRDPKDVRELRDLLTDGDVLLRAGKPALSIPKFDAVLAQDPANRFALLRSGVALLAAGDPSRAASRLSKAVDVSPEQPEARSALARALVLAGRPAEAVPHAMEAARLHPRLATSWAELGTALGRAGKIPEAVQAFEKAVNLEPQNPSLLARLAFAEHAAGRITDAARDLLRSAEKSGAAFAHSAALGVLLYDSGRRQEARRWLEASRSEDPDFAEARYRIALLEAEAGDPEAARRALAQAIAASPGVRARAQNEPRLAGLTPRQ
jgi:arylsulfatase A-like enzyme/Flp pilus assembly protein TadD